MRTTKSKIDVVGEDGAPSFLWEVSRLRPIPTLDPEPDWMTVERKYFSADGHAFVLAEDGWFTSVTTAQRFRRA